jgi:hypothetical protein
MVHQERKGQLPIMQNSSSPDSSLAGGFSKAWNSSLLLLGILFQKVQGDSDIIASYSFSGVNTSGGDNGTVPPQPHTRVRNTD